METDIVRSLMLRQQINFLIEMFTQLDVQSLSFCLDVSEMWRDFLMHYVLNAHRGRILRRAWTELSPQSLDGQQIRLRGSVSHLAAGGGLVYASYTDGKYGRVGENHHVEELGDDTGVRDSFKCSSSIKVGDDIEVMEILGQSKVTGEVYTTVLVRWRESEEIIYNAKITKDSVTTLICGNSVFIRLSSSTSLEELLFSREGVSPLVTVKECPPSSSALLATAQLLIFGSDRHLTLLHREDNHQETLNMDCPARQLASLGSSVLVLSDFSLWLLRADTSRLGLVVESCTRMTAVTHNRAVVALLDVQHTLHVYSRSELEDGRSGQMCVVSLPTVPGPYCLPPAMALTDEALYCAERGANTLHVLSVWPRSLG